MERSGEKYSFTRLSCAEECPRKYDYKYVRRRPEAFDTVEAFLGQTVHATLAWLYSERERRAAPGLSAALEHFDAGWSEGLSPRIKLIRPGDSFEAQRSNGHGMIRSHYQQVFSRDRLRTVAVEEPFELLLRSRHRYVGTVDRVAEEDGAMLHVIDFKTGRPPAFHGDGETLQLRSYGLATLLKRERKEIKVSYHYLKTGETHTEVLGVREARRVVQDLATRIEAVQALREFPPRPSRLCAWCGYRDICDASGFAPTTVSSDGIPECPLCGGDLEVRYGRRGAFVGCSSYPDCRFTRDLTESDKSWAGELDGSACPRCGGGLELRHGRRGPFLGCENFPTCRYSRDP